MLFSNQTFLVAGLSRSGIAAAEHLLLHGAKVYCFDDAEEGGVPAAKRALSDKGCRIVAKEELSARAEECDILVLSPGIPIDHPLPLLPKSVQLLFGPFQKCLYACTLILPVTGYQLLQRPGLLSSGQSFLRLFKLFSDLLYAHFHPHFTDASGLRFYSEARCAPTPYRQYRLCGCFPRWHPGCPSYCYGYLQARNIHPLPA